MNITFHGRPWLGLVLLAGWPVWLTAQTLDADARFRELPAPGAATEAAPPAVGALPAGAIRFSQGDVIQVLDIYQELSGRTVLRPHALPQTTISIRSEQAWSRTEAMEALETALAMEGIAMIPLGDTFVKAVPLNQAWREGAPLFEKSADQLPNSGTYVVFPLPVRHLRPTVLAEALAPYASFAPGVQAFDESDLVILSDQASHVRKMVEIARRIDRPTGSAPRFLKRPGPLLLLTTLLVAWLAWRLMRDSPRRQRWTELGCGVALALVNMGYLASRESSAHDPWSIAAAGWLWLLLVPWLRRLHGQWLETAGTGVGQAEDRALIATWLGGLNLICLLAVALLGAMGFGYAWLFLVGGALLAAGALGWWRGRGGPGPAFQKAEIRRALRLLEANVITEGEFRHRVAVILRRGRRPGAVPAATR